MKILIACEFSGVVRDEFLKLGHDAYSCDILSCESEYYTKEDRHFQCDIFDVLYDDWDMMIAHPPCTHLSVSGARWFKNKKKEQKESLDFVKKLLDAPIKKIALENPVSIISTKIRKPNQYIQPYEFGHPESKKTGLWLKGLPKLNPTNILSLPEIGYWENQCSGGQNKLSPSKNRGKLRSLTYTGIAKAMADQWGK